MQSTFAILLVCSLAVMAMGQQPDEDEMSADKRVRQFAFAKRSPYRAFAFAKRGDEDSDDQEMDKRARFAFAKRAYRQFAFAKRASPYGFAFAKRGLNSFA